MWSTNNNLKHNVMGIQDKIQDIHSRYGTTEKANYEIQLYIEALLGEQRAKLLLGGPNGQEEEPRIGPKVRVYSVADIDEFVQECISSGKCVKNSFDLPSRTVDSIEWTLNNRSDHHAERIIRNMFKPNATWT